MATPNWTWVDRAACHGEDLVLFFGPAGEKHHEKLLREPKAIAVCDRCPVKLACRKTAFVLKQETGVWGGLGEDERRSKRRSWLKTTARQRSQAVA